MHYLPPLKSTSLAAALCSLLIVPMAGAVVIDSTIVPNNTQPWNTPAIWNDSAPTAANDYRVSPDLMTAVSPYIVNGVTWTATGQVRDVADGNATTSIPFEGNSLILPTGARILGKSSGGSTQTVDIVFNGGFVHQAPVSNAISSSTLAGTITFGASNVAALAMSASPNGSFVWNINSTIVGGIGDTLQLAMGNAAANPTRVNVFNLSGDLSSFAGTLYLGVTTGGTNGSGGTGTGSFFSISSNALSATVQMDTTTPGFLYDLGSGNVTFGALALGSGLGSPVGAGVYDAAGLNTLAGGSYFTGLGTITVVPEPSTTALSVLGLLGGVLLIRSRQRRRAA